MWDGLICLCREVNRDTGEVAAYALKAPVTDRMVFVLGIRQRVNPELRYYIANRVAYEADEDLILRKQRKRRGLERVLADYNIVEV